MTCSTCERIRRFFRNGVQKLAPFTEYDDKHGNTYVVTNSTGELVGSNNNMHKTIYGKFPVVTFTVNDTFMHLYFGDGQAMGFPIITSRKVFSNRFA